MRWQPLDRIDSGLYKGLAILMIVLHNFMHLFPNPKEIEFEFYSDRFPIFINLLFSDPENSFRFTMSYFGHFGVQIFIFLSAYGLTKKYTSNKLNYWEFIGDRCLKIYPSFCLAIFIWMIVAGWLVGNNGLLGPLKILFWGWEGLLLTIFPVSNLIPGTQPPVGPWWFIPFILQFYILYPFILKSYLKLGNKLLLILSAICILFSMIYSGNVNGINLYLTLFGHFPELCLGIYMARKNNFKISKTIVIIAFAIYLMGNYFEIFWYTTHISMLVCLLGAFSYIVPPIRKTKTLNLSLSFLGRISMPLFLVNGFLREPFISWAKNFDHWFITIALCSTSLAASVMVAFTLFKAESITMNIISKTFYKK